MGVGASAGGINALKSLFSAIPPNLGMAYVVVQHLSSSHRSNLREIIQGVTSLTVREISEEVAVEPDTIYVRTPQFDVRYVAGGKLVLDDASREVPNLPIDKFFISIARELSRLAIGIVLTGMGADGSRGAQAIKERGGLVLVQDPRQAEFSSMPQAALSNNVADFTGDTEELAKMLAATTARLARERVAPQDDSIDAVLGVVGKQIVKIVEQHRGTDFGRYRPTTIRRRIEKRMLIHQLTKYEDYLLFLQRQPAEVEVLANSFLIGVTRFFRDPDAFAIIRRQVLPELVERSVSGQPLRLWVPACSTGEEAYSLAILLEEYIRENAIDLEYKILASDIDPRAIDRAGLGVYLDTVRADVPPHLFGRYFVVTAEGCRVVNTIRDRILFAVHNLLTDPPFIRIDLLSCRNFLIYVDPIAQEEVLSNFHFSLGSGGFMMLGPSESLGRFQRAFAPVDRRWKIFRRVAHQELNLPLRQRLARPLHGNAAGFLEKNSTDFDAPDRPDLPTGGDQYARYLADRYAPIVLFVDENYTVKYVNGDVDHLLRFPRQTAQLTLGSILSEENSSVLKAAVDTVLSEGNETPADELLIEGLPFREKVFEARLRQPSISQPENRLVLIELNVQDIILAEETEARRLHPDELLRRQIITLEEQLQKANLRTQKLLAELESTNEELQTSNRELLASNEEMQSTNEELQSVNEELYTVNHESQIKNEQLKRLNSDMTHLLESTEIGTIFLDDRLCIRRFTPSVRPQFDLHYSDIGRPLSSFSNSFENLDLMDKCRRVIEQFQRHEEEVRDRAGNFYLLRILPYRGPQDSESGLIITFINIGDLVETRLNLAETARKFRAIFRHTDDTIILVDRSGRITELNHWMRDKPPYQELVTTYLADMIGEDREQLLFNNALRVVFDEQKAITHKIRISSQEEEVIYGEFTFIPIQSEIVKGQEDGAAKAMIIIRDLSTDFIDRKRTQEIIKQYRDRLIEVEKQQQMGLMTLEGDIVDLNYSTAEGMEVDDFIQRNVEDFLTNSGIKMVRAAFKRLIAGSKREMITYQKQDLTIPLTEGVPIQVQYEPLIIKGKVAFVIVKNITK